MVPSDPADIVVALYNPLEAKLSRLLDRPCFRVFDHFQHQPRKWPKIRQEQISSKPASEFRSNRSQSVSTGLKPAGYFFYATRKGPDMLLLEDSSVRPQILTFADPRKWPFPTTLGPKSSKRPHFVFFRFARSNDLEKPVFWIYGSGGCLARDVAQKCEIRL